MKRGLLARRAPEHRTVEIVRTTCGAHAQILSTVPLALGARTSGLTSDKVIAAINDEHTLIKTWSMRGTLHVLTVDDLPLYCAALGTTDMYNEPSVLEYLELKRSDVDAVLEAIPVALDGQILTREELADAVVKITKKKHLDQHLRSGWGSLPKPAAFRGLLCFGPQSGRSVTFVRPDQWIGEWKNYDTEAALVEVFRRFLGAYGPATKAEIARWLGVSSCEAGRVLDLMHDELAEVSVAGTARIVLESDLRSFRSGRPIVGVRLLPSFDQLLVMSAPHSEAIVDPAFKARVYRPRIAVWSLPTVMINGRAGAAWRLDRRKRSAIVSVDPFSTLPRGCKGALDEEVARLGAFLGTEAQLKLGES